MVLHLIRHSHTQGTAQRLYYGQTDLPITPEGVAELAEKKQAGGYPSLDGLTVYTTGLQRTTQTLEGLYGAVAHTPLPGFQELNFGIFEMQSHDSLQDDPQYQTWISGEFEQNIPPQGESFHQFRQRIITQLEALLSKGEDALVVAHAGTISVIMSHLFPQENKHRYAWAPNPGEGYSVTLGERPAYSAIPKPYWADKHYAFFQNTQCEYFPCHKTQNVADFNCLFCYCPLYALGNQCGGDFTYTEKGDKNCTHCTLPHQRTNYGKVLAKYPQLKAITQQKPEEK